MAQEGTGSNETRSMDERALASLVGMLSGASRKDRQSSAHTISQIAQANPEVLVPYIDNLVDAIDRPEAQTRWEVLDALSSVCSVDPEGAKRASEGAEEALYDEESGMLRATAFRFFSKLAATSQENAAQIWPLLDEALQCFHGDPEYLGMLEDVANLLESGCVDARTRGEIASRVKFDAQNGKGRLASFSKRIIDLCGREGD
ncbi:MAG: hypothetical protein SOI26_07075 [Coriobacteriales bacterium]|jgi:hypothetical protein